MVNFRVVSIVFVFVLLLLAPDLATAQSDGGLVTCTGLDCDFCNFATMVDNIIDFLVTLLIIIATIILAITGLQMAYTAAGGGEAREILKDRMTNIIIGFILIIASWVLVDTLLKALVTDDLANNWRTPTEDLCFGQTDPGEPVFGRLAEGIGDMTDREYTAQFGNPDQERAEGAVCDESQMQTISAFGNGNLRVHESIVSCVLDASREWESKGGNEYYQVRSVHGYTCRKVAGTNRWSNHARGLALDFNPLENPHNGVRGRPNVCETDMEESGFANLMKRYGFGWGCDWNSSKDAMHFSMGASEGGNGCQ